MRWELSHRADAEVVPLADRHYNRQKIGAPQFAPPGRCLVLKARVRAEVRAFWITSWPFARYVRHRWAGAWVCSAFRNEGAGLSSELIREAVAATRAYYGIAPAQGIISFVDVSKVKPKADPGYCYLKAGFTPDGFSVKGLLCVRMMGVDMPLARPAVGFEGRHRDFAGHWFTDLAA